MFFISLKTEYPSDGWADPEVHNDPKDKREEALKFGANIIIYALSK